MESESGTEIADFGFLISYEKPVDSRSHIWILIAIPVRFSNVNLGLEPSFRG